MLNQAFANISHLSNPKNLSFGIVGKFFIMLTGILKNDASNRYLCKIGL